MFENTDFDTQCVDILLVIRTQFSLITQYKTWIQNYLLVVVTVFSTQVPCLIRLWVGPLEN